MARGESPFSVCSSLTADMLILPTLESMRASQVKTCEEGSWNVQVRD